MTASLVVISLVGVALVFYSTPWGIGVGHDSVFYLSSAQNLLRGRGLIWPVGTNAYEPLIHYPPLYPLLLAGFGLLRMDLTAAAGMVSAILFGVNILLAGLLTARVARLPWVPILVALFALGSPILLDVHLMAMTEPLFLCLAMLTLIALSDHFETGKAVYYWWAAAFTALAGITRYAGPSLAAVGFLALLTFGRGGLWRRLRSGTAFVGVGLLPLLAWYARNISLGGSASNREISYHPPSLTKLKGALVTISEWWIPPDASSSVKKIGLVLVALVIAGLFAWLLRRRGLSNGISELRSPQSLLQAPTVLVLFIVVYTALLLASLTFVDASTRLNNRILSPIYLTSLPLVGVLSGSILDRKGNPRFFLAIFLISSTLLLASYGVRTTSLVSEMRHDGRGFTGREWQSSETIALVQAMDIEGVVYSSEALPLFYLTGQAAFWVPEKIDPLSAREISGYRSDLLRMKDRLRAPGSYLVLFDKSFNRVEMPPFEEVVEGFEILQRTPDGSIWVVPRSEGT
jgi:hypothetical protein